MECQTVLKLWFVWYLNLSWNSLTELNTPWKKIKEKLEFRHHEICRGIWSSKKGKIYKFVWFLCPFERVSFRMLPWVWQWNIEYTETDRHGSILFYGGGMGVVSPLPPPKIIFSRLKQNLRQFKKILTPILTISPKAKTKKSTRVCMKGWVAISNNKHVLIFYISTLFPTS